MYDRFETAKFRRDVRLASRRGKDVALLMNVINKLADGERLAPEYRDHALKGKRKKRPATWASLLEGSVVSDGC